VDYSSALNPVTAREDSQSQLLKQLNVVIADGKQIEATSGESGHVKQGGSPDEARLQQTHTHSPHN